MEGSTELLAPPEEKSILTPCITVLSGGPGAGKSELGSALSSLTNAEFIDIDAVRANSPYASDGKLRTQEEEKEAMEYSYREMMRIAKEKVAQGTPVILAATFSREFYHQQLEELVNECQVPLHAFYVTVPEDKLAERINHRAALNNSHSNIRTPEDAMAVHNRLQQIPGSQIIDTSKEVGKNIKEILEELKRV